MLTTLLTMSLSGALMICVIFLVRLLLQNRTHRGVWLLLWGLVLVRLFVPLIPRAPSSIYNLSVFRRPEVAVTETVLLPVQSTAPVPVTEMPKPAPALSTQAVLLLIWTGIAVGVFSYFLITHLRATRQYRFAIPVDVPDVPARVRVKELEGLTSPLTYGLLRPVILLPPGTVDDPDDCRRVLAHELAHIRHGDVLYKWLLMIAASVHWFNPLVWVMLHTASQDLEIRADASAVKSLGETEDYARMLIRAEEQKLNGYLVTGFSVSNTALRLRAMLKGKASRAVSACTAVLLAAALLTVCCTGQVPVKAQAAPSSVPTQTEMTLPTEATEAPILTEEPTETPSAETKPAPTEEPTEAPTEAPMPTEAPTEAPMPTEAPAPAEPTETVPQTLPTPEPSNQLPTSYSVPSPGSVTLHVGESQCFSLQSLYPLSFSCSGNLYVDDCTVGPYNSASGIVNYSVKLTAQEVGTFQVYCINQHAITILWATVTVLP